MFRLCSCVDTMNQGDCTYFDEKRCIVGQRVVDDVRKAVEMYGLVAMFEFWEYKVPCFDKDINSPVHFAEYVNMFLKMKHESSGYQACVQCEEDKER